MQHDLRLRAAARAIYDACYPSDDWARFGFDEAERYGTVEYRQAVARKDRVSLAELDGLACAWSISAAYLHASGPPELVVP